MRPLVATVDLTALRHNYLLAKQCAPQRKAFAVVKANAYGHGAHEVVTALRDVVDGFAVACLEEAEGCALVPRTRASCCSKAVSNLASTDVPPSSVWMSPCRIGVRPTGCWMPSLSGR